MKLRVIVIKIITFVCIVAAGEIIMYTMSPMIANELSLLQMNHSSDSSVWIHVFTYLANYAWVVSAALAVLMFRRELIYIFKFIKSKVKEENNYEEI